MEAPAIHRLRVLFYTLFIFLLAISGVWLHDRSIDQERESARLFLRQHLNSISTGDFKAATRDYVVSVPEMEEILRGCWEERIAGDLGYGNVSLRFTHWRLIRLHPGTNLRTIVLARLGFAGSSTETLMIQWEIVRRQGAWSIESEQFPSASAFRRTWWLASTNPIHAGVLFFLYLMSCLFLPLFIIGRIISPRDKLFAPCAQLTAILIGVSAAAYGCNSIIPYPWNALGTFILLVGLTQFFRQAFRVGRRLHTWAGMAGAFGLIFLAARVISLPF